MEIIPAIDIVDGRCVRLIQGDYQAETVYANDPSEIARRFEQAGATRIHVVDLNGARDGKLVNLEAIQTILKKINIPIQLGGGIRTFDTIELLLNSGIDRVILGTLAFQRPEILKRAVEKFGSRRIVVGIDARQGKVAVSGWQEQTSLNEIELALSVKKQGVERINYTDISRDGMLTGPNLAATKNIAVQTGLKITASGGISSLQDIDNLKLLEPFGVDSVIVGRAIYEKQIDLEKLLQKQNNRVNI